MIIFIRYNEGPAVLVAGGPCGPCQRSSEIFLIDENRWIKGPDVKVPGGRTGFMDGATYSMDDQTLLFAGGLDAMAQYPLYSESDIFQFNALTNTFTKMDGSLRPETGLHITMTSLLDDQSPTLCMP